MHTREEKIETIKAIKETAETMEAGGPDWGGYWAFAQEMTNKDFEAEQAKDWQPTLQPKRKKT